MTLQEYIDEIKLELTGNLINIELTDETLGKFVDKALREIQRYIDTTKLITVPFARCIDLTDFNCSSVTAIYRTKGYMGTDEGSDDLTASSIDPFQAQMWQIFSNNGSMYKLEDYVMNYLSYNTLMQMRSASSTDLIFKEDKQANKLYINVGIDVPTSITIEYVPKFLKVEDVTSDYWIDILQRLSVAFTKVALGRIRSRYVQTGALWTQDGDKILEEGNTEVNAIRETLRTNSVLFYPVD